MSFPLSEAEPASLPVVGPAMGKALRVLIVHNAYQHRGGEDSVAESEIELLRAHGHTVETYWRSNDEIASLGRAQAAMQTFWSSKTVRDIESLVTRFKPDVIHAHNTMPLISPSLYWVASRMEIPVVQTLHNFRLLCPQALLLRESKVCEDCVGKVPWRGVVRACYRGSVVQSGVMALMLSGHRALGTWQNKVSRYIALNEFARSKYIEGGLPADRIAVKPNFVDVPSLPAEARSGFLFVGRLSQEKGIQVLMDAIKLMPAGTRLRVVGSGPLEAQVRGVAGVDFLGPLDAETVYREMRRAQALVLPSICYENFPRTIVEAFACGLPVLASDLGPIPGIVANHRTGILFPANNPTALALCLQWALDNSEDLAPMGAAARIEYESKLSPSVNYAQLVGIYQDAIQAYSKAS